MSPCQADSVDENNCKQPSRLPVSCKDGTGRPSRAGQGSRRAIGDNILQPGPYDGGSDPADKIGTLADFVEIKFNGSNNVVDAAIASIVYADVMSHTGDEGYGQPSAVTALASPGDAVTKYGRTTEATAGTVDAINAEVNVCYQTAGPFRCKQLARFVGQIVITPGSFSAGGDSGSGIVTAVGLNPVALLFAGSSSHTIANPIQAVLDAFGVTIDDGSGGGSDPGNDPPTADDVNASGDEDQVLPILWSPSVSDPNGGDVLGCSITTQPANGSASVGSDCPGGTYTPNSDFNGSDPFTYAASDGSASDQGTVTVVVNPINDAPVASDNGYGATIGTTLNMSAPGVLGNDSDVDGDGLTTILVGLGPSNASSFVLSSDGSFSYESNGTTGEDSFTYEAFDGTASSNVATVTITVSEATDAMHVGDLTQSSINQGSTWDAVVTITIVDTNGLPVLSADVVGTWSGPGVGNRDCITNQFGWCTVQMTGIRKRNSSVSYTVDDVAHLDLSYDEIANVETSITVIKP